MNNPRSSRLLVALLGVLTVAGAAIFNAGFVGQTLASWNDRVFGSSTFGTNSAAFEGFAQAVGARYHFHRRLSDSNLGGARAQVKLPKEDTVKKSWVSQSGSGTAGILAASMKGSSCASYYRGGGTSTCTDSPAKPAIGYAYGAARDIEVETATVAGIDLLTSQDEISTSATCLADGTMIAGPIKPSNASLRLGPWISGVQMQLPPEPIVQGADPAVTTRSASRNSPLVGYEYTATLIRTKQETSKGARSELRLQMMSIGKVTDEQKWSLDLVLAYAECGVGMSVPTPEWPVVDGSSVQGAAVSSLASLMLGPHKTSLCSVTSKGTQPRDSSLVDEGDDDVGTVEATPTESVDSHLVESVSGTSFGTEPAGLEIGADELEVTGETDDRADESMSCELDASGPSATSPIDYLIDENLIEEAETLPEPTDSREEGEDVRFGADDGRVGGDPREFDGSTEGSTGASDPTREDNENGKGEDGKSPGGKTADETKAAEGDDNSETSDSAVDEARESEVDGKDTGSVEDATSTAPTTISATPPGEPAPTPAPVQTPAPNGPSTPSRVSARVPFSMVASDGSVLGTATVRDVSRSSGCVAVLLEVETSDGSGSTQLNGVRARDFREVLPDGGTAPVGSPTASCGGGASMPASFSPNSTYTGWVTFDVLNGGNAVMLRPSGTAGWIFTLPSAPAVSVPTSVTATPATTGADVPDEEASTEPAEEAARPTAATAADDNVDE